MLHKGAIVWKDYWMCPREYLVVDALLTIVIHCARCLLRFDGLFWFGWWSIWRWWICNIINCWYRSRRWIEWRGSCWMWYNNRRAERHFPCRSNTTRSRPMIQTGVRSGMITTCMGTSSLLIIGCTGEAKTDGSMLQRRCWDSVDPRANRWSLPPTYGHSRS